MPLRWNRRMRRPRRTYNHPRYKRFRKRLRKRTYRNTKNKTSNALIGKRSVHLTLRSRIKRLEISSKKHYDYMLSRPTGVPIEAKGASNGTVTNESFTQMLAIQPTHTDGTIPAISGSVVATERNTREGMEIYCTKVRIRGRILGIRAADADKTKNCVYNFTDAITGTNFVQEWFNRATAIRAACQSRVHIMVLQDTRPSTIDPATGVYEPNPLPVQPFNALQGLYSIEGITINNSLETLGMDSALRNYHNNRFKVVHNQVLTFDYMHPAKWFDISINVNRKLKYKPPVGTGPQGNSDPVNYNLLFYVSAIPAETAHAASAQFVMNDVSVNPYVPVNLLAQPNLQMISSRTYFRET